MQQYNYFHLSFSEEREAIIDELTSQTIAEIRNLEEGIQCVRDILQEYQKESLTKDPCIYQKLIDMLNDIFEWYLTQQPPFRLEDLEEGESPQDKIIDCLFFQEELEDSLKRKMIWFSQDVQEPFIFDSREGEDDETSFDLFIFISENECEILDCNDAIERIQEIARKKDWSLETQARVLKQYERHAVDISKAENTPSKKDDVDFHQN